MIRCQTIFLGKKSIFGYFWLKYHFFLFSKKSLFNFFNFFRNLKHGTHFLFRYRVKLNADSEFLVHFDVGLHFKGFWLCVLRHMTRNPNIPFTKDFFAQNIHALEIKVSAKIEALFIRFQFKKKFDPHFHTFCINIYMKYLLAFYKNCRLLLGVPRELNVQNQKGKLFWIALMTNFKKLYWNLIWIMHI